MAAQKYHHGHRTGRGLNGFSIAFAYHSGKIEDDNVTYNETRGIFEHDGATAYTGALQTLFEIRNAKGAYEMFLSAFQAKRPLDEPFIKELRSCLTQNTYDTRRWQLRKRPGEYKRHDCVTGCEEVGAASEDVADETRELLEELRDMTSEAVLTAAAHFHAKFENSHPYVDGNERAGRLAINYLLVYLIGTLPPSSTRRISKSTTTCWRCRSWRRCGNFS